MRDREDIHLVEPGGQGGVFQHAVALGNELTQSGYSVVLHTADDHERFIDFQFRICGCVNWYRYHSKGPWRKTKISGRYLFVTIPHLIKDTRTRIVHFHGLFASPLYAVTILLLRVGSSKVLFSPHNTFIRSGSKFEKNVLDFVLRQANTVIVYSEYDRQRINRSGVSSIVFPLLMPKPLIDKDVVSKWHQIMRKSSGPILLLAGQIRQDKGIEDLIIASQSLSSRVNIAIVGEDKGDYERCKQLALDLGVDVVWHEGFLSIAEFAAVMCAADVIVTPYYQASQSGVLVLANALQIPSVSYPVGGLSELASFVCAESTPSSLVKTLDKALSSDLSHIEFKVQSDSLIKGVYR